MAFTVVELRSEVAAALAATGEATTWEDGLLDAALRRAVRALDELGPVYEATVAATAGAEQNLSSLPDLLEVTAIAWPWQDGEIFEARAMRWRPLGAPDSVRLRTGMPAAGDSLRVRYRKVHALQGLDGAAATTVPVSLRAVLALGGACYAAQLRQRQTIENPALPDQSSERLQAWAADLEHAFITELVAMTRAASGPVWEGVGL